MDSISKRSTGSNYKAFLTSFIPLLILLNKIFDPPLRKLFPLIFPGLNLGFKPQNTPKNQLEFKGENPDTVKSLWLGAELLRMYNKNLYVTSIIPCTKRPVLVNTLNIILKNNYLNQTT